MAKVVFKDKKSLQDAKRKTCGNVSYRQTKDGRIIAAKWSRKKKKNIKITEEDLKFIHGKDYVLFQEKILPNCFCGKCCFGSGGQTIKIVNYEIFINDLNDVELQGFCAECGGKVGRYLETEEVKEYAERVKKIRKKYGR